VNGLTLLALIALAIGIVFAYRAGRISGRREARAEPPPFSQAAQADARDAPAVPAADVAAGHLSDTPPAPDARAAIDREKSRLVVAYEAEAARLNSELGDAAAIRYEQEAFAEDRRKLLATLADARGETARYRQLVVDFETNAPPTLLGGPGSPDDLKLIVGIGPMLERMLQQLGITTFRQIARWSERDVDEFDAKLAEFPGRIRRDGWVVQARSLHQSKYGERA
jgi:predicted flap endonuclease-1-like 5' DNA nuclease